MRLHAAAAAAAGAYWAAGFDALFACGDDPVSASARHFRGAALLDGFYAIRGAAAAAQVLDEYDEAKAVRLCRENSLFAGFEAFVAAAEITAEAAFWGRRNSLRAGLEAFERACYTAHYSRYDKTIPISSDTLAAPDTAVTSPTSRSLARDAAAIAAAAAPPARRPREPPPKWLFPPERAPNAGRAPPPPEWWELHAQAWLALSGRQRKWLGRVEREQGRQRARESAVVAAVESGRGHCA